MAKGKGMNWLLIIAVVVVAYFLIAGNPFATDGTTTPGTGPGTVIQCNKDFTATVAMLSRNEYAKAEAVNTANTVAYKVWKVVGGNQIPQADLAEGDNLLVGYDEEYLVVATVNGSADVLFEQKTFRVDTECNAPRSTIFYLKTVPSAVDTTFESPRITGPNAAGNRVPLPRDVTRNVRGIFNGESKTEMDAIIVFDADRNIITEIASDKKRAVAPADHTTGAGERSYAFELGKFVQSADVVATFDFTARDTATLGDYNVTYTIYSYQLGFEHTRTGDWVSGAVLEDNDDNILLPSYVGTVFLDITA